MPWDRAFAVDASARTVQFWIDYDYHHFKRFPRRLIAQIPVASQGRFELLAEGSLERLAKRLGLASEVQTRFAGFDERCYLIADHPEFTRAFFRDRARREAAQRLLGRGATNVMLDGGELSVAFWFPGDEMKAQAMAHEVAADLAVLGAPPVPALPASDLACARRAAVRRVAAHAIAVATVAWWMVAILDSGYRTLDEAFQWSLVAAAVAAIAGAAALLLRGQAQALRELAIIAAFAFLVLFNGGEEMLAWLNGRFDGAPASSHRALVLADLGSRLKVRSWRPGHEIERVPFAPAADRPLAEGDHLLVVTRPGWLGREWVVEARLEPQAPATAVAADAKTDLREDAFREAVARSPGDFEARRQLDAWLARQGRWDEVVAIWDEFLLASPQHAGAYLERAGAYHHGGDAAAAMRDLERACALGEQRACGIKRREATR